MPVSDDSSGVTPEAIDKLRSENQQLRAELALLRTKSNPPPKLEAAKADKDDHPASLTAGEGKRKAPAPAHGHVIETLILRINLDNTIAYANDAFCRYVHLSSADLVGRDSSTLQQFLPRSLYSAIAGGGSLDEDVVTIDDTQGRVFEVRTSHRGGMVDVTLQDITNEQRLHNYIQRYTTIDVDDLSEDELNTFKFPERRYMSVSFTDLRGFTSIAEGMSPEEVRATVNAYLEEVMGVLSDNNATVDKVIGDEVMALFGAPRYYADHPFRAIKTACDQVGVMSKLQRNLNAAGRVMPLCGVGINTGEMVLGNIGTIRRQNYTVLGRAVNIANRLCAYATGGQILTTEETLKGFLSTMPEGWQSVTTTTAEPTDLSAVRGLPGVSPLRGEKRDLVYLVGPGVEEDFRRAEYYFYYLYQLRPKNSTRSVPVVSVVAAKESTARLSKHGETITLASSERIFGKYRLTKMIGRGGMGEVWKARDHFGNTLAIKMLLGSEAGNVSSIRRFKREAQIMSRFNHRNICRIFEVGEAEGKSYIAMEYIEGATLGDVLSYAKYHLATGVEGQPRDLGTILRLLMDEQDRADATPDADRTKADAGRSGEGADLDFDGARPDVVDADGYLVLPLQQTLGLLIKTCEAIQHAHEQGILHRDLKPGNIIIRPDGEPVIMDFGLAKLGDSKPGQSISISGQIVGTIDYMAPEQALSSKTIDERADVYSLGAILYQMLTGRKHFTSSGNLLTDAHDLQEFVPASIRAINKNLDTDLDIVTLKALRADPDERYRSALALRDDLEHYRAGEIISAKPVTTRELAKRWLQRNQRLAAVVMTSLFLLVVMAVLAFISLDQQRLRAEKARQLAEQAEKQAEDNLVRARASEKKALESSRQTEAALKLAQRRAAELEAQKKRAQKLLERYEAERRAKGEAWEAVTAVEEEKKRLQQEKTELERASIPVLLSLAREEMRAANLSEADDLIRRALELEPTHVPALLLRARLETGKFKLADAASFALEARVAEGASLDDDLEYFLQTLSDARAILRGVPLGDQLRDIELRRAVGRVLYSSPNQDDRLVGALLYRASPPESDAPDADEIKRAGEFDYSLEDVAVDEATWPEAVKLTESLRIPVTINGKKSGQMRAEAGSRYELVGLTAGNQLKVRVGATEVTVPQEKTDFLIQARSNARSLTSPAVRIDMRRQLFSRAAQLEEPTVDALDKLSVPALLATTREIEGIVRYGSEIDYADLDPANLRKMFERIVLQDTADVLLDLENAAIAVRLKWQEENDPQAYAPLRPALEFLADQARDNPEAARRAIARLGLMPTIGLISPLILSDLAGQNRAGALDALLEFYRIADSHALKARTALAFAKPTVLADEKAIAALVEFIRSEAAEVNRIARRQALMALRQAARSGNQPAAEALRELPSEIRDGKPSAGANGRAGERRSGGQ